MGGSVLPVSLHNNKIYFLFGKERLTDDTPGWSDFGGGTEHGETQLCTAIREGVEEMTGFLGDEKQIKYLLNRYGTYNIDYKSDGYSGYRVHIFPMKYDEQLIYYYNNNQRFLQKRLDVNVINKTKIFEKIELKWFSINDILKNKNKFRPFYKNIIKLILDNKEDISRFINKSLNNKSRKHKKSNGKSRKRITI